MRISLRDLSPETIYALQLRSHDGSGTYSDWSRIFKINTGGDGTIPATPDNFEWVVSGTSFLATWDDVTQNADSSPIKDLDHYELTITDGTDTVVYKTTDNRFDFTFEMNVSAFNGPRGALTATLRAVDKSGNKSEPTDSILAVNPPPPMPANFVVSEIQDGLSMEWDAVDVDDLKGYRIYASTDSGFTPGPTNLVWTGLATNAIYTTFVFGSEHHVKLAAFDVFETNSDYATGSGTPRTSLGADATAPDAPTGLVLTPSVNVTDNAKMNVLAEWDDNAESDLAGYRLRWRVSGSTDPYQYKEVTHEESVAVVEGLELGTEYEFSVQAFDTSFNYSTWHAVVTTELANVAPSKPSNPVLVGSVQSFAVQHDMQKAAGGQLESDVVAIDVYVGNTSDWSTASPEKVESIAVSQGSPVAISRRIPLAVPAGAAAKYIFVKAVDSKGLESTNSDGVAVTVNSLSGTYIEDASITSAKINSLEANKLTAGSGIINNLDIKSALTIQSPGKIRSTNYVSSGGTAGFELSDSGLIVKTGTIEAAALKIQQGSNLLPPEYAGFEFASAFYAVRGAWGASDPTASLSVNGSSVGAITVSVNTSIYKYESQSLRIVETGGTWREVYLGNSNTVRNIALEGGRNYIVSGWVYNAGAAGEDFQFKLYADNGSYSQSSATNFVPAATWTRYSFVYSHPSTSNAALMSIVVGAGANLYFDGLQIEEQIGSGTEPSAWKQPGATRIDGGIIRTGEIRSSSNVFVNGVLQPSWLINTQGKAQFGDALVRGKIIVGANTGDVDAGQSMIQSPNYVAGTSGWAIKSDGTAQLSSINIVNTVSDVDIKSNDYIEAEQGWIIKKDGTAQFQNLQVVETLGAGIVRAEEIYLAGESLAEKFDRTVARPVVRSYYTTTTPYTSGEIGFMQFKFAVTPNHTYRISSTPIHMQSQSGTSDTFLRLRYTRDGTQPTASSPAMLSVYQDSTTTVGNAVPIVKLHRDELGYDHEMWVLVTIGKASGGNARVLASNTDREIEFLVEDLGHNDEIPYSSYPYVDPGGGGGTPSPPPKSTYTKTYAATWSRTYDGDNSTTWDDSAYCYQGYYDSNRGHTRSLIGFNYSQIMSDLSGATVRDIRVTFKVAHAYYNAGTYFYWGTHAHASKPSTYSGVTQQISTGRAVRGGTYSVFLPGTVGNGFKAGTIRGLGLGPGPSGLNYYGYIYGATQAGKPYLTIRYDK